MKYDNLVEKILNDIPELKNEYLDKAEDNLIDEATGVHVVFGLIVTPYVVNLLKNDNEVNTKILKKIFVFFEDMAKSEDSLIQEVLEFTVIEGLIEEGKEILSKSYSYMLDETRQSSTLVERFFNIR